MTSFIRSRLRLFSLVLCLLTLTCNLVGALPVEAAASHPSKLQPCVVSGKKHPKTITKTQSLAFKITQQNDSSLAQGETQTLQAGHTGTRLIIYTATYKKNKLASCKHTGTKVSLNPVSAIVEVGTYVAPVVSVIPTPAVTSTPAPTTTVPTNDDTDCTNGTYVNSDGNTVCSPETSSSVPSGATAQCVDGTYSFSQHRSGTCSYHGGVASWL
jgi:hypothetical protein